MGNATDELKAIADEVTESVDNAGIAKALYKYFSELFDQTSEASLFCKRQKFDNLKDLQFFLNYAILKEKVGQVCNIV